MKNKLLLSLFIILITQLDSCLGCQDGYFKPTTAGAKCYKCLEVFTSCTSIGEGTPVSRLVGYKDYPVTGKLYCSGNGMVYNKETNSCQDFCKAGCKECIVDYDFCTQCQLGYTWNSDHTCGNAIIGLEATSLAILVVGLVFTILSCCLVKKARK